VTPFGIADFGGDLIDAGLAGLEQMHGALDPQILEVFERRFAQHDSPIRRASVRLLVASSAAGLIERESPRRDVAAPQRSNFLHQRIGGDQVARDRNKPPATCGASATDTLP